MVRRGAATERGGVARRGAAAEGGVDDIDGLNGQAKPSWLGREEGLGFCEEDAICFIFG